MSIKSKLSVSWQSYQGNLTNDPADVDKISGYVEEDSVTQVFRTRDAIADETVDKVVTIPDDSCNYLVIFSDQTIEIKLNGSVTALTCSPRISTDKCPVFVLKGEITALTISNDSGSVANVDIILALV
jgi:hypothetical protein